MMKMALILSERRAGQAQKAFKISVAVALILIVVSALRMAQATYRRSDLANRIQVQENTLKTLRDAVKTPSAAPVTPPDDHSVAQLQTDIQRAAQAAHCTINDFLASPDRMPYISVFVLDTKPSNWEQVTIHITLKGTLASALTTIESLSRSSIPIEADSIEIARQTIDEQGIAQVIVRFEFRALVQSGGKA